MNAPVRDLSPHFDIVAFPCNQFGLQEPGHGVEILHGIRYVRPAQGFVPKFAMASKINVNGPEEHRLYTYLKSACKPPTKKIGKRSDLYWDPVMIGDITWNFEKFLVDAQGKVRYRFEPSTPVEQVISFAQTLIAEKLDGLSTSKRASRSSLMKSITKRLMDLLHD